MEVASLYWPHRGFVLTLRWHLCRWLVSRPGILNRYGASLTIVDGFGAPGDTLLTAIVCRQIKRQYPRLRINCVTANPELLAHDPNIDSLNEREDYLSVWHWYLGLLESKNPSENVLAGTFLRLGIEQYDYGSRVYLTPAEERWAEQKVGATARPVLTFNTRSKEVVKNWPLESWRTLIERLRAEFELIHLGDATEPVIEGVRRFAGEATLRESMALLSRARLHVGPDSFLMHVANGLNVPATIVFGGSRTPANLGYSENTNLFATLPCGPCWIHASRGEHCENGLACLAQITVEQVHSAVLKQWRRVNSPSSVVAAIPVLNASPFLELAIASVRSQTAAVRECIVVDDGSSDRSASVARDAGARVVRHGQNFGRGAARATIMAETDAPLILMCDASLQAAPEFLELALKYFEDASVGGVYGRVVQVSARSVADRWRERHLFRRGQEPSVNEKGLLATGVCVLRRAAVEGAGGFNPKLRSGEDADLGRRLLRAGWKVIADAKLSAVSLRRDSTLEVLGRFARWNSPTGLRYGAWRKQVGYAVKVMARQDLAAGDLPAAILSLASPLFQLRQR